jgi:hypothetical protein
VAVAAPALYHFSVPNLAGCLFDSGAGLSSFLGSFFVWARNGVECELLGVYIEAKQGGRISIQFNSKAG